jgi:hypothetical protein
MFATGDPAALPDWLSQLENSRLPGLPSFAKVFRDDLPAVVQAVTSPYNSGVNEGRITDVKLQNDSWPAGQKSHSYANESYSSHTYAAIAPKVSKVSRWLIGHHSGIGASLLSKGGVPASNGSRRQSEAWLTSTLER